MDLRCIDPRPVSSIYGSEMYGSKMSCIHGSNIRAIYIDYIEDLRSIDIKDL